MEELKELVEDIVEYTRTWSISETEWYWNIACVRKSNDIREKNITSEEFERAIREEILYALIYDRYSIQNQMENDYQYGYEEKEFDIANKELEKKIQKIFKDFKVERWY